MTLENIYYIGQTVAVVLIFGSLVAIYIQQRKDHLLARVENQREILNAASNLFQFPASSPAVLGNIRICLQDYESADPVAQADFAFFMHQGINLAEQGLYMHREKLINKSSFVSIQKAALVTLVTPGGRQYWARMGEAYGADIQTEIDAALKDAAGIPPVWDVVPQFSPIQPSTSVKRDAATT